MLTPEDARRLIKNRQVRESHAHDVFETLQQEKRDYLENQLAIYIAQTNFADYATGMIDKSIKKAIAEHEPIRVGFAWNDNLQDGIYEKGRLFTRGIDGEPEIIANMLAETIWSVYKNAG